MGHCFIFCGSEIPVGADKFSEFFFTDSSKAIDDFAEPGLPHMRMEFWRGAGV